MTLFRLSKKISYFIRSFFKIIRQNTRDNTIKINFFRFSVVHLPSIMFKF